jgi:hypothetical protein
MSLNLIRQAKPCRIGKAGEVHDCSNSGAGEIGELLQRWVDADQGELGLDNFQVQVPDVGEDAAHPTRPYGIRLAYGKVSRHHLIP